MMLAAISQWAMVPDTVEYGHWKLGIRSEGVPIAFFSFSQKMGMALAGAFASVVLGMVGYEADAPLTALSEAGIRWLFNLVPAVCSGLCVLALLFYRLTPARFETLLKELRERGEQRG